MHAKNIPEYDRIIAHDTDIAESRITPQLENNEIASALSEDLVAEAEQYLEREDVRSKAQYEMLLEQLDTAIAINNDPKARDLRARLERTLSGTLYFEHE